MPYLNLKILIKLCIFEINNENCRQTELILGWRLIKNFSEERNDGLTSIKLQLNLSPREKSSKSNTRIIA